MVKALKLLVVLAAGAALAQTPPAGTTRVWQESQALTRSPAAPASATDGMDLNNVYGLRVTVCAPASETLTGGSLRVWLYDYNLGLWTKDTTLDMTVAASTPARCLTFPDQFTTVPYGRVLVAADSVTVSSGSAVTVQIQAYLFRNAR